jgi:methylmalonyl-CoA carboxyltransferase large subunit
VGLNLADFAVIAVLVVAGCGLSVVGMWLTLRQTVDAQKHSIDGQLSQLADAVKALEARLGEPAAAVVAAPAAPVAATAPTVPEKEEITPEMLVVIAAAVTAFLGKKVRIRSAKMLHSTSGIQNPWSQQGRALIQASHNLRLKG